MGFDQPECGAGRASPTKKSNIRSSGCRLQFFRGAENGLLVIALQISSTIFRHAVRAIQGA
jgi:hypothetical protein